MRWRGLLTSLSGSDVDDATIVKLPDINTLSNFRGAGLVNGADRFKVCNAGKDNCITRNQAHDLAISGLDNNGVAIASKINGRFDGLERPAKDALAVLPIATADWTVAAEKLAKEHLENFVQINPHYALLWQKTYTDKNYETKADALPD